MRPVPAPPFPWRAHALSCATYEGVTRLVAGRFFRLLHDGACGSKIKGHGSSRLLRPEGPGRFVFRELARKDEQVARVLREWNLL